MRLPRGSASTALTVAAGGLAAAAVGATGLPMVQEAALRERAALTERVSLVAELASQQLAADPEAMARMGELPGVDELILVGADGSLSGTLPAEEARALVAVARCTPDPETGRGLQPLFRGPKGADLGAACARVGEDRTLLVVAGADYQDEVWRDRQRTLTLLLGLGSLVGLVVMLGMRYLLSPIQMVSVAASRIAAGERDVRVEPKGPEEISDLARAVNALASAMDGREDEIRSRMQAVNELSSIVAHEVRNPLHSLALLCELARTEPDDEKRSQLIGKIEAEIHALEGVVQRFLRNSGPLRISRQKVDVIEVLKRAAAVAEPKARAKRVRLMLQAPGRLECNLDGSLVRRSIENLLLNAIEFAALDAPGHVTANVLARGKQLVIMVDDDGPGVPLESRERIFQPYQSSKSGGTGLGLALVHKVVTAHGGTIRCEDSPLGGARFLATLPLERGDGSEQA